MLYRISVAERVLTGIANIFRGRLSGLDDLLRAGTVPLSWRLASLPAVCILQHGCRQSVIRQPAPNRWAPKAHSE